MSLQAVLEKDMLPSHTFDSIAQKKERREMGRPAKTKRPAELTYVCLYFPRKVRENKSTSERKSSTESFFLRSVATRTPVRFNFCSQEINIKITYYSKFLFACTTSAF